MTKQLLIETMGFRLSLQESAEGGKLIARGRFALADVPTANNRVYSRGLWIREIARLKKAMVARKVFGEADHPEDGRTKLTRVAHIMLDLHLTESGEVIGTAEIIDTDAGKNLKAIWAAGGQLGVSSRGYGSITQNVRGEDVVQEDYQLDTFDFVVDPAQDTAYPEIAVESKETKMAGKAKVTEDTATKPAATDAATPAATDKQTPPEKKEDDEAPKTTDTTVAASATQLNPEDVERRIGEAVARAKAELRAEVRSELLSDPKVAGSKAAMESVKTILRPFILDKDVAAVVEQKDAAIKAMADQLAASQAQAKAAKLENVQLSKAVTDLGYKLYVTTKLSGHPQLESVIAKLGDLTVVENIDKLDSMIKPHLAGIAVAVTESLEPSKKALVAKEAEVTRMTESVRSLSDANKKLVAERDQALVKAHTAALGLYLERKISLHPAASKIRLKFKEMNEKTKDAVDALVEAFSAAPRARTGTSDFDRIRGRLRPAPSRTLVEDAISDTAKPQAEETMAITEGLSMDVKQIQRLAGIK